MRKTFNACRRMSSRPCRPRKSVEQRADRGSRDAVLSRAGFRDDALLVHASREQHLAERVVDLVRTCVQEIFTLR